MTTLFAQPSYERGQRVELAPSAFLLPSFATSRSEALIVGLQKIYTASPFRRMVIPGGFQMAVEMTDCGTMGWITDKDGYRYDSIDPLVGSHWPEMPTEFITLAAEAALESNFEYFDPNVCLANRYEPKSKLSLHQDKDEKDFTAPIVSVSLGLTARFLFGDIKRSDPIVSIPLYHGDVVVWGGPSRLRYHGIAPVHDSSHPTIGSYRINLTFRRAT
jgi:DNA oxidative demethylase